MCTCVEKIFTKIYLLSRFQVCNTALLILITLLYITSPDLLILHNWYSVALYQHHRLDFLSDMCTLFPLDFYFILSRALDPIPFLTSWVCLTCEPWYSMNIFPWIYLLSLYFQYLLKDGYIINLLIKVFIKEDTWHGDWEIFVRIVFKLSRLRFIKCLVIGFISFSMDSWSLLMSKSSGPCVYFPISLYHFHCIPLALQNEKFSPNWLLPALSLAMLYS